MQGSQNCTRLCRFPDEDGRSPKRIHNEVHESSIPQPGKPIVPGSDLRTEC